MPSSSTSSMYHQLDLLFKTIKWRSHVINAYMALSIVFMRDLTSGNTSTNDLTYIMYPDLQLPGCHLVNLPTGKWTRVACAIFCSTDSNCAAFKFDDVNKCCMKCMRNNVTGINFLSGEFTSLPRVMRQSYWPFVSSQFTNRSVAVPGGLKEGMVVRLTGVVLSSEDFYINFEQADDQRDVNFHFHARKAYGTTNPILVFNYYRANKWGNEIQPVMSPYPFKANKTTRMLILVREDMFVLYIDNKLCCNYTHVVGMSYTKVNYIRVIGGIQVYEISS